MTKTTKSIRIEDSLWKEVKVHVAKTDTDISSFIEDAIKDKLNKKKKRNFYKSLSKINE